ncbi:MULTISPECIES: class I SAM-dependent methyltransferase [Aliarcobacter]|jgi:predicted nicotinamide N-methyase|uniref:Methyltransferase domain-containing protein n=1 Tax=Arcobacter sp. AZ-2023 TaxID=3074453 RepID=A0AA96DNT7_9BACT|nr:methyltransferase domain-containing protein [Aliarcobacter cryaerophilus]WNL30310.1 methyltransferase domain-containing protein [Arcobacter sp. AZ-2023]MCT7464149.1 protein N-lysine methyltransferase family protein [Aliarcobacter cryaerophilus]MCT7472287.1 protein N-lysine methyltransferase family protein [Aliarcobacter cryaerophilus]MCT7488493.1 protein N-lysine methyltransferase family protein [Aliarcobacter cryaerophilus]MCT7492131.1 protein N-lysine methyltransferase family protein [Ali
MKPLRYKYQTIEFGDNDIHLRTLKDKQQFSDKDKKAEDLGISSATWSLFGVVWPSSEVLANFIFDYDFKNKRILEVGCGIGLSSLILNRLNADITATDYHPEAEKFLDINTELNKDDEIPFVRTCWSNEYQEELGKFDLIIGSDLLYERDHAVLLSNFINAHANDKAMVILVNPNRGYQSKFTKQMETFGFSFSFIEPKNTDFLEEPYKGKIFKYSRE